MLKNNKPLRFLLIFLLIISAVILYFYTQPAVEVEQLKMDENLPPKFTTRFNFDTNENNRIVYIPYKFKISNNRLLRLEDLSVRTYKKNETYIYDRNLIFDADYFPTERGGEKRYKLEEYLENNYFKYLKLKNNGDLSPFSSKTFYVFTAFFVKDSSINISNEMISMEGQRDNAKKGSPIKIPKKITDSLRNHNLSKRYYFSFSSPKIKSLSHYRVMYPLNNPDAQKITNVYREIKAIKTKKELSEYFMKSIHEDE